jgi:hypothetical protein
MCCCNRLVRQHTISCPNIRLTYSSVLNHVLPLLVVLPDGQEVCVVIPAAFLLIQLPPDYLIGLLAPFPDGVVRSCMASSQSYPAASMLSSLQRG